ncbi:MAG: transporter substrate-binding domain-containing protein [Rhodospirillales bacterium]|nr:transporter substrate-binding domain-containing protein [Rhodospirillales bacterium]
MRSILAIVLFLTCVPISIAHAETLKIGYSPDWGPYSVVQGKATVGILPALLDEIITRRLGVPLEHVGLPWKRAQSMVKAGSLDALLTYPSATRLQYAERSGQVVYNLEYRAFVRKGSKAATALAANPDVETLKKYCGCVVFGNDWGKTFYATHKIPYQDAVDVKNCLRLLSRDRVDFLIQATAVGLENIRQMDLQEVIVPMPRIYGQVPFVLLISKKSAFSYAFMAKFDAVVKKMTDDGSLQALVHELDNAPGL